MTSSSRSRHGARLFCSSAGRTLDLELFKRLQRQSDSIAGLLEELGIVLEASKTRAR